GWAVASRQGGEGKNTTGARTGSWTTSPSVENSADPSHTAGPDHPRSRAPGGAPRVQGSSGGSVGSARSPPPAAPAAGRPQGSSAGSSADAAAAASAPSSAPLLQGSSSGGSDSHETRTMNPAIPARTFIPVFPAMA